MSRKPKRPPYLRGDPVKVFSIKLADRYRAYLPTYADLMNEYGMSRATAYRWVSALQECRPHLTAPSLTTTLAP